MPPLLEFNPFIPPINLPQNDNVTQSNGHNGSSLGEGILWTLIFLPQEFSVSSTNKPQNDCIFIPPSSTLQFSLRKAQTALHHWAGVMSLVERQHALLKKHKAPAIPAHSEEQMCLWRKRKWMSERKKRPIWEADDRLNGLLESCLNRKIWLKDNSNGGFQRSPDRTSKKRMMKTEMLLMAKHPSKVDRSTEMSRGNAERLSWCMYSKVAFTLGLTALSKPEMDSTASPIGLFSHCTSGFKQWHVWIINAITTVSN